MDQNQNLNQLQNQTNKQLVFHLNEFLNSETLSHKRRKNFAPKELNIIISMVEENADLIYNRVNKNPKFMSKQEFWQACTNLINENCHFAAQRDVKEVRRKWVTFQSEVKSKAREGTHLLNVHEKRVHDLIQLHSQISELGTCTPSVTDHEQRLTMLPTKDHSPLISSSETDHTPTSGVLEHISQNNSPASSLSSNTSFSNTGPVKMDTDTELLMNICSQVMGLAPGDISAVAGMDAGAIKDIIAKPIPVSKVTHLTSTAASVTPILSPAAINHGTPTRNVVSVQPVNHVHTPPKRARLDGTPTNNPLTNTLTKLADNANALNGASNNTSTEVTSLLREMVEQQKLGNKIAEERLAVEKQRRDLEQEKVEIERARYEIEKERLCQEIIGRKKP